jgi:RHS repeat-associated protein
VPRGGAFTGLGAYAALRATYYPFGEKRPESNSNLNLDVSNQAAFGTYQRDANGSGGTLDYAMNRYYAAQWGRFTTPDPYQASAQLANPQSWNRYSYVENDPVNKYDPGGLCALWVDSPEGPVHYNLNCWVDGGVRESVAVTADEALPQGHPASEGDPYDLGRAPGGKLARAGVKLKAVSRCSEKAGGKQGRRHREEV